MQKETDIYEVRTPNDNDKDREESKRQIINANEGLSTWLGESMAERLEAISDRTK